MSPKKVLGIFVVIVGVVLLLTSIYIRNRVSSGRMEIASSQQQVDQTNQLFSSNRATKQVGRGFTESSQRKINAANLEAGQYDQLVLWFQVGGIVLIVLGAGIVFVGKRK